MGNAICCPSVTYMRSFLLDNPFDANFSCDLDWAQWEKFSRLKGSFLYVDVPLMCHRIHEDSETSVMIGTSKRAEEDYEMFCRFWPAPIAAFIERFYASSEKSNEL